MKKLLALLLAFLLPCCAFAEPRAVTVRVSTDDAAFAAYAKEILQKLPGITAETRDKYVQVLRTLLKDTRFTAITQADAESVDISIGGKPLLDLVVYSQENASYLTTSMLPGYALVEKNTDPQLSSNGPSQLNEAALSAIAVSVENAVSAWMNSFEPMVSYGSFQGDAYSGGTKCTTWLLSDQDIAALVSAMATEEVRAAVTQLLRESGADAVRLLQQFDDLNDRVAKADAYMYILRVVHDDEDRFVGLSLTILEGAEQLATVSFGKQQKELRLVIGLGLKTQNYWREYILQGSQENNLQAFKGFTREWVANKAEAFSSVSGTNLPVQTFSWSLNISQADSRYLWDASLYEGITNDADRKLVSCTGSFTPADKALEADFSLIRSSSTPLKMQLAVKPAKEIPPLDSSIVVCSASNPADAERYAELNKQLSYELTRRLVTLLPMDLLLILSN